MSAMTQRPLTRYAEHAARGGLAIVLLYIGLMKFTRYEAEGIQGLIANSPLMSWLTPILGVRGFSALIGVTEIVTALLIVARPFSARAAAVGSALAVGTFLTTLTFLFTTPGVIEPSLGFPGLSTVPGQFLLKDVALLGISLWSLAETIDAIRTAK